MRSTAKCPGCREPMNPAEVMCRSCMGKLPAKYKAEITRAYKRFAKSFTARDKATYEATCRTAAKKVRAILDGSDTMARRSK